MYLKENVLDLLTKIGMMGCQPSDTSIEAEKKIEHAREPVDKDRFQRLVGKLIYLSHTRPDIAFSISVVS